ncbi:MAG: hypothetical protein ACTHM1_08125 [Solirubrobacteraceae bacterium]
MTGPLKWLLASMMALGSLGSLTIAGTFAFSSESVNGRTSLATGTLTLSDTANEGTICHSYSGSENANGACAALMSSSTLEFPGESAVAKVKIANDGSLDGGDLVVYMPSCTAENTPSAPKPGAGNPCAGAGDQLYVQETNSSWETTECWYPVHKEGSCAWVKNGLFVFNSNHKTAETAVNLEGGPKHGQARYFEIGLRIPPEASSELQGREAVFALTWRLQT